MSWLSILFVSFNQLVSTFLTYIIYHCISTKKLISLTIIDLIYCDVVIYNNLTCLFSSAAIIHSLLINSQDLALSYELALGYSTAIDIFVTSASVSLIFGGFLRLLTLLKRSEEGGLQLLGPENLAIVKVRWISIAIGATLPIGLVELFNAQPGKIIYLNIFFPKVK